MIGKFLCFIGLHNWYYYVDKEWNEVRRCCWICPQVQVPSTYSELNKKWINEEDSKERKQK